VEFLGHLISLLINVWRKLLFLKQLSAAVKEDKEEIISAFSHLKEKFSLFANIEGFWLLMQVDFQVLRGAPSCLFERFVGVVLIFADSLRFVHIT